MSEALRIIQDPTLTYHQQLLALARLGESIDDSLRYSEAYYEAKRKGAPFNCLFCHNPETIHICRDCGLCVGSCPVGALSFDREGHVAWDGARCVQCDTCIRVCPHDASPRVRWMTVEEVLAPAEPGSGKRGDRSICGRTHRQRMLLQADPIQALRCSQCLSDADRQL